MIDDKFKARYQDKLDVRWWRQVAVGYRNFDLSKEVADKEREEEQLLEEDSIIKRELDAQDEADQVRPAVINNHNL